MKSALLVLIASATLLAGCDKTHFAYTNGSKVAAPASRLSDSGYQLETTYAEPNSPKLSKWSNGIITMSCPKGYHASVIRNDDSAPQSTCEPNPPPK